MNLSRENGKTRNLKPPPVKSKPLSNPRVKTPEKNLGSKGLKKGFPLKEASQNPV